MERMYAQHNIDRLNWIKSGRTRKDSGLLRALIELIPIPEKDSKSLKWDIDQVESFKLQITKFDFNP